MADPPPPTARTTLVAQRRLAIALFTIATIGVVSGREVLRQRRLASAFASVEAVVKNAIPSVRELSKASGDLRAIRLLARELDVIPEAERAHVETQVEAALQGLDDHVRAYESLPLFPGEREMQRTLDETLADVRLAARLLPKATTSKAADDADRAVFAATDKADAVVGSLILFNSREAFTETDLIESSLASSGERSSLLLGCVVASLIFAALATERRLARAEREAVDRETRRHMEDLDAFAARAAHDLKGPLSPAVMAVAVLKNEDTSAEREHKALETLERSHRRMVGLIDGLLAFARAGRTVGEGDRPTALADAVREVSPALLALAEVERGELRFDVEPGLGVAASVVVLGSILDNLVRNALLYLGDSTRRGVSVRARGDGSEAVIEVEDTGPGMPPDVLARLFRPFERASQREGTGLGLSTVKRLAEAHGGSVGVRSEVGQGTTFVVRFPRERRPRGRSESGRRRWLPGRGVGQTSGS